LQTSKVLLKIAPASSTAATEETTSAPADVATPVTQEASTDGQRISLTISKENRK
jgi:hypothetical protein